LRERKRGKREKERERETYSEEESVGSGGKDWLAGFNDLSERHGTWIRKRERESE
jgi:hypothetical protein